MKVYLETPGGKSSMKDELLMKMKDTSVEIIIDSAAEKSDCSKYVYLITPELKGINGIVNAVNDSNHHATKTVFCTLMEDDGKRFTEHQIKSLVATGKMVQVNGGVWCENMEEIVSYLGALPK